MGKQKKVTRWWKWRGADGVPAGFDRFWQTRCRFSMRVISMLLKGEISDSFGVMTKVLKMGWNHGFTSNPYGAFSELTDSMIVAHIFKTNHYYLMKQLIVMVVDMMNHYDPWDAYSITETMMAIHFNSIMHCASQCDDVITSNGMIILRQY